MAQNNEAKIHFPYFQVKSAGVSIEHTNNEAAAVALVRTATKPAEVWLMQASGACELRYRVPA